MSSTGGWAALVRERLGSGDQTYKTYYANYQRKAGPLIITHKKLLFIEEKGFLHKAYNVILEIPNERIKEINVSRNDMLVITDADGKRHEFVTGLARSIGEAIREQMPVPGVTP